MLNNSRLDFVLVGFFFFQKIDHFILIYQTVAATGDILEPSEAKEILTKERQQRDHFINLNQMLVEEIKQKSKMTAGTFFSMLALHDLNRLHVFYFFLSPLERLKQK